MTYKSGDRSVIDLQRRLAAGRIVDGPFIYNTFTPVDTNYDEGDVVDVRNLASITLMYSKTASDADDTYIKVIYLLDSIGSNDYQEVYIEPGASTTGETTVTANVYVLDKAVGKGVLPLPTYGCPFMRIDMTKKTDAGTDSTITTHITRAPR